MDAEASTACQTVTPAKIWLVYSVVKEATMHGTLLLCSWQTDYIESLTFFWDYWILPHCFDIISGYGIAVPTQSADSSYTIVVLTAKLFHVLGFLDNFQRPSNDELLAKEFNGHPMFSTIHSIVECWNDILKNQLKRFLIYFLSHAFSWSTYILVGQFGHLMWLSQEGFVPFGQKDKWSRVMQTYFENLGFHQDHSRT